MTALYVPGVEETDPQKSIRSLQLIAGVTTTNTSNIATNTTNIATNTTNIATNTTNIATNTASIAAHEAAWTSYTPTFAPNTGAFTTASATGKYKAIGKTVFVTIKITITTNGTAAGFINATLPVTQGGDAILTGRETAVGGKIVSGTIGTGNPTSGTALIINSDNTYPGGNGFVITVNGVYEST